MSAIDELKQGDAVIYHGSLLDYHGILFRVLRVHENRGLYDLDYYHDGGEGTIIRRSRRQSLTPVRKQDILHRTCEKCGWGPYWYLRNAGGDCPVQDRH